MPAAQRRTVQAGFSKVELVAVVIVFGILAAILLNRLTYYQEAAEKAKVEYTVSAMKNALRHRMAEMLIAGRAQEYRSLANDNPMDWLAQKPSNYLGVLASSQADEVSRGNWYFDSTTRELVYVPNNASYFQPDAHGRKRIRLQLVPKRNFATDTREGEDGPRPTDGVALELVEPYFWF